MQIEAELYEGRRESRNGQKVKEKKTFAGAGRGGMGEEVDKTSESKSVYYNHTQQFLTITSLLLFAYLLCCQRQNEYSVL